MAEENKTIENSKPKKNLKYERDKDREKVKGIFKFYECPGAILKFSYKKYKGDDVQRFILRDNEVCTIPLGVAKHLNKSGWYPVHKHIVDKDGRSIYAVGEKKRRYGFQSLEFVDPEDFDVTDNSLLTVEKIA